MSSDYIAWFEDPRSGDVPLAGGKNASLGEMVRSLKNEGVRVPDGSATTAKAYREYDIAANQIGTSLREGLRQ